MARCIDADALIHHFYETEYASMYYIEVVKRIIDEQPTISPDDVRGVGHWITEQEAIDADDYSLWDTCSVCGRCDWDCTESTSFKYCPNCGAKMKGADENASP